MFLLDLWDIATRFGKEEVQCSLLLGLGAGGKEIWRNTERYKVYKKIMLKTCAYTEEQSYRYRGEAHRCRMKPNRVH